MPEQTEPRLPTGATMRCWSYPKLKKELWHVEPECAQHPAGRVSIADLA